MDLSFHSRNLFLLFAVGGLCQASAEGINNFQQVDQHVFRGAQPTAEGFKYLSRIGIKTVIDLREVDGRAKNEAQLVKADGMNYVNVPMTGLTPPTEIEIAKLLSLFEDTTSGPVFVHCKRGADRTGAVIAAYRIDHDHWGNARALKEAMAFGMSFFQLPRQHFIQSFQARNLEAKASLSVSTSDPLLAPLAP
jgi:protein tyrosine/serine phosphatase